MDFVANLPGWAILGSFTAIVGSASGWLAWQASKEGYAWGRYVPIICVALVLALANDGRLERWVKTAAFTPNNASELLIKSNPRLYGFLKDTYPNDYAVLTKRFVELVKSDVPTSQIGSLAAEAMGDIRRKYAPMVGLAPDADHTAIIQKSVDFYEALLAHDVNLCNRVAMDGPQTLIETPGTQSLKAMVEPQAIAVLQAASHAMSNPVQRRMPTDDDWAQVGELLVQQGATDAELAAIAETNGSSPDFCPAIIKLMKTFNSVDSEAVKAVRASYIAEVSAS